MKNFGETLEKFEGGNLMAIIIKQFNEVWRINLAQEEWEVPEKELKDIMSHLIELKKKYGRISTQKPQE